MQCFVVEQDSACSLGLGTLTLLSPAEYNALVHSPQAAIRGNVRAEVTASTHVPEVQMASRLMSQHILTGLVHFLAHAFPCGWDPVEARRWHLLFSFVAPSRRSWGLTDSPTSRTGTLGCACRCAEVLDRDLHSRS